MNANVAVLECRKCHKQSAVVVSSTRQVKDRIKEKTVVCPECGGVKMAVLDAFVVIDVHLKDHREVYEAWRGRSAVRQGCPK